MTVFMVVLNSLWYKTAAKKCIVYSTEQIVMAVYYVSMQIKLF